MASVKERQEPGWTEKCLLTLTIGGLSCGGFRATLVEGQRGEGSAGR